jgi:ATP-binding cassette, subfamily B, bacterial
MKILFSYLKKYKGLLFIAMLLATVAQLFSLLDTYYLQLMMRDYGTKASSYIQNEYLSGILMYLGIMIGLAMISRIAKNFQDYFLNVIIQKIGSEIFIDGLKHSLNLPYIVYEDSRSGETLGLLSKIRTDIEKLLTSMISTVYTSIVGIVFVVVIALKVHWAIAPVYLLTIPVLGSISAWLGKKIKGVQKKIVKETTALSGDTTESLRNIELVKSLGLEQQETNRLQLNTIKVLDLELTKVKILRSLSFLQGTSVNFMRNVLVFVLLMLMFEKSLTIEQFYMFMFYSFFIFNPLYELGNIVNNYKEAEVSLNKYEELLAKPEEVVATSEIQIPKLESISFEKVSFQYPSAKFAAIENLSLEAKQGETIAFVGPSGSGKSTLVKLILGLYQTSEGKIKYNDVAIQDYDIRQLRNKLGYVTQDTQLFSGTIKENLLFVNPQATDEECHQVMKQSASHNLISRTENGIETLIGENGVKLSGGEKQRLSIARALLRKPWLLVFDEATSALDSITEEEITKTIREISNQNNLITILIAHRLSTVAHADKIYVLEKGQIIENGKHQELIEQKGLYYAMWRQQIGER